MNNEDQERVVASLEDLQQFREALDGQIPAWPEWSSANEGSHIDRRTRYGRRCYEIRAVYKPPMDGGGWGLTVHGWDAGSPRGKHQTEAFYPGPYGESREAVEQAMASIMETFMTHMAVDAL